MNPSKARAINTQFRWHEKGAISAPFGYPGIDGVYVGLTPTDESVLGCGEFKVVIDAERILLLIATGLKVERLATARHDWRAMTAQETTELFNPDADVADVTGITYGESGISILFLRELPYICSVIVVGMFGYEVFGASPLFKPSEVAEGMFATVLQELERECGIPGAVPRLSCKGVAPGVTR